jgi:hypothetical protein
MRRLEGRRLRLSRQLPGRNSGWIPNVLAVEEWARCTLLAVEGRQEYTGQEDRQDRLATEAVMVVGSRPHALKSFQHPLVPFYLSETPATNS